METIASLPDAIMEYFDRNPNASAKEAVKEYYERIKNLDGLLQIKIMENIVLYKKRIDAIEKYINMPEYKNNPAKLLCDIRGFNYKALSPEARYGLAPILMQRS